MGRLASRVQKGDRFLKQDGIASLWEVVEEVEYPDLPRHVRLLEVGGYRKLTYSTLAVLDKHLFKHAGNSQDTGWHNAA